MENGSRTSENQSKSNMKKYLIEKNNVKEVLSSVVVTQFCRTTKDT